MLKAIRASMCQTRRVVRSVVSECPSLSGFGRLFPSSHHLSTLQWTTQTTHISYNNTTTTVGTHYGNTGGNPRLSSFSHHGNHQQIRLYRSGNVSRNPSSDEDKPQQQRGPPELMEFPWVVWPSLWHTIRNWIFARLLIHRYLDQEFDMTSFTKGAVQALVHVSHELSKGNFEALEGLVTTPSLDEIKKNFAKFSLKQRLDLAVEKEDIFFSFPYQIGMIFTNEGSTKERIFVEITMCYHIFRGFQDYVNSPSRESGMAGVYDNKDRISIANYRFIREFTKGVVDDWTITLANHFKPGEHLKIKL